MTAPRAAHAQAAPAAAEPMASERLPSRPACLLVASGAAEGESRASGAGPGAARRERFRPGAVSGSFRRGPGPGFGGEGAGEGGPPRGESAPPLPRGRGEAGAGCSEQRRELASSTSALPAGLEPSLEGVSAQSFLHCFTLASAAFNLQVATPGGKTLDFVDVNESNARWVQDFRLKAYASPAKLESIDGARYHALLIPSCPGALADLASSGSLARILQHFCAESKPICAVGHGVAALCCATNEDRSWVFQGYSVTGPSVYELVRAPGFAHLPLIVEDFAKDAGACFSASQPDAVHVVLDRHLVTGQNAGSTVPAVQNLLFLCGSRK